MKVPAVLCSTTIGLLAVSLPRAYANSDNAMLNTFEQVAGCANVELDTESCLATTAIEMLLGDTDAGEEDSGARRALEGQVEPEHGGQCQVPQVDEATVALVVSAAQQKCTVNGNEISQQEVDETVAALETVFGAEDCWKSLCDDKYVRDEVEKAARGAITDLLVSSIAGCAGIELDTESCLVTTTIDIMLSDIDLGEETMRLRARRILEGQMDSEDNSSENGISSSSDDQCEAPQIDEATVRQVVSAAQQQCMESGVVVEQEEVEEAVETVSSVFAAEDCWTALCPEEIEKQVQEEIEKAAQDVIAEVLVEYVASCAEVELDMESCLVSTTIGMMLGEADTGVEGIRARRMLEGQLDQDANSTSTEAEEQCQAPQVDDATVRQMVSAAQHQCMASGVAVEQQEVEETVAAVDAIFGAEQCWKALCPEEIEKQVQEQIQNAAHEIITDVLVSSVAGCAGVELDTESCLVSTTIGLLLSEPDAGDDGMMRARRILEGQMDPEDSLQQNYTSSPSDEQCEAPEVDEATVRQAVAAAQQRCVESGVIVEQEKVEETIVAISSVFDDADCWKALCPEEIEKQVQEEIEKAAQEIIADVLVGYVASCAEVELDTESCLVSTTIGMMLSEAGAGEEGMRARRILEGQMDNNGDNDGLHLNHTYPGDGQCQAPQVDEVTVSNIVSAAQQHCSASGVVVAEQEVEETVAAINTVFGTDDCWMPLCFEKTEKQLQDEINAAAEEMTTELMLDFVAGCAEVELDHESCLVSSVMRLLTSKDSAGGMSSRPGEEMSSYVNYTQYATDSGAWNYTLSGNNTQHENHTQNWNHDQSEEEQCQAPQVSEVEIRQAVSVAQHQCASAGVMVNESEVEQTINTFKTFLGAEECWQALCTEDVGKMIASKWLGTCAYIDVPLTLPSPEKMAVDPEQFEEDATVACMLNYIMSSPPSEFGFVDPPEDSKETCFPPGHSNMNATCPTVLGPAALEHCYIELPPIRGPGPGNPGNSPEFPQFPPIDDIEMSYRYGEDLSFSFDYKLSYDPFFSYNYDDVYDDDEEESGRDTEKDAIYIEKACFVLKELSSEHGKQCLLPLCDFGNGDDSMSGGNEQESRTGTPSAPPSKDDFATNPSMAPTGEGHTLAPTSAHSHAPSEGKSSSASPVDRASGIPTAAPTISVTPTVTPTAAPTSLMGNGKVEMTFEAGITIIGLNLADVPLPGPELDAMVKVLKTVISDLLPTGAEARILRIGGIAVSRRFLRQLDETTEGVDVEFEVVMEMECDTADCTNADEISDTAYGDITAELEEAVTNGALTSALQEEASAEGVTVLEEASVGPSSFKAKAPVTQVKRRKPDNEDDEVPADDDENDDDDDSSALVKRVDLPLTSAAMAFAALHVLL